MVRFRNATANGGTTPHLARDVAGPLSRPVRVAEPSSSTRACSVLADSAPHHAQGWRAPRDRGPVRNASTRRTPRATTKTTPETGGTDYAVVAGNAATARSASGAGCLIPSGRVTSTGRDSARSVADRRVSVGGTRSETRLAMSVYRARITPPPRQMGTCWSTGSSWSRCSVGLSLPLNRCITSTASRMTTVPRTWSSGSAVIRPVNVRVRASTARPARVVTSRRFSLRSTESRDRRTDG